MTNDELKFDDAFKQNLQKEIQSSYGKIKDSRIFLMLLSENTIDDPVPVLQLGMAILMNKPIAVLAINDVAIPDELIKVSSVIERVKSADQNEMKNAITRILLHFNNNTNESSKWAKIHLD